MRRYVAVAALAAVLVACSNGEESGEATEPGNNEQVVAESDDADDDPDDDGEPEDDADTPAPAAATPAGEPLAVAEHPLEERGGSLDIELRAIEVGELLRVEVTFIPRDIGDERARIASLLGSSGSGVGMSGRLIDPVNLLEYETVRAAVPHGQSTPAYEDQPTTLHFYFAAPVEELETFDFLLDFATGMPDWPGFVDVPFGTP